MEITLELVFVEFQTYLNTFEDSTSEVSNESLEVLLESLG